MSPFEMALILGSIVALGASAIFYFTVKVWMDRRRFRIIDRIIAEKREADARRRSDELREGSESDCRIS